MPKRTRETIDLTGAGVVQLRVRTLGLSAHRKICEILPPIRNCCFGAVLQSVREGRCNMNRSQSWRV